MEAVVGRVNVLMIQLIGEGNHLTNTWPVGSEAAIGAEDVNPLKLIEADGRRVQDVGVLGEHIIKAVPARHDVVEVLLGFTAECGILQLLELFLVPAHENVCIFGPHLDHLVVAGLILLADLE